MSNNINKLKIVALGASGTGKTSYLAGIFHQFFWNQYRTCNDEYPDDELVVSIDAHFMKTVDNVSGSKAGNDFIKNLENFNLLRNSVNSRTGTMSDETYDIDLTMRDNEKELCVPIEIYDYKGGIADLNDINTNSADVTKLILKIKESDIIYILIDSSIAKQYDGTTEMKKLIEEKLCTRFFSELFRSMINENEYSAKYIQFIFTKWDAVSLEQRKTVYQCLRDLYGSVIRACKKQEEKHTWRYDMKPITLFGYTEKTKEIPVRGANGLIDYEYELPGEMNPEGLDTSFMCSIKNALSIRCDTQTRLRIGKERQIRRYYELMKCYQLGMKEKRKLHDEIVTLQRIKDGYVREHFSCNQACEMLNKHIHFSDETM